MRGRHTCHWLRLEGTQTHLSLLLPLTTPTHAPSCFSKWLSLLFSFLNYRRREPPWTWLPYYPVLWALPTFHAILRSTHTCHLPLPSWEGWHAPLLRRRTKVCPVLLLLELGITDTLRTFDSVPGLFFLCTFSPLYLAGVHFHCGLLFTGGPCLVLPAYTLGEGHRLSLCACPTCHCVLLCLCHARGTSLSRMGRLHFFPFRHCLLGVLCCLLCFYLCSLSCLENSLPLPMSRAC